jgi:hypothetical protein
MAFPNPPKTWSAGETLTAANFNAQIRDALLLVPNNIWKLADQSVTSSTVLVDDTHIQFAIGANEAWNFRFVFAVTSVGGLKFALNSPAGSGGWWSVDNTNFQTNATFVDGETCNAPLNTEVGFLDGYVLNSATPGTFKLRWAQSSSNGTPTVLKKGSWLSRQKN